MKLCGFLAPDGTFSECDPYSHTWEAQRICENKHEKRFLSGIKAEDFLHEQGYVGFYSRDVSHRFIVDGNIILLTSEQVDFVIMHLNEALNADQKREIERLLEDNEAYSERSILKHYERKIT